MLKSTLFFVSRFVRVGMVSIPLVGCAAVYKYPPSGSYFFRYVPQPNEVHTLDETKLFEMLGNPHEVNTSETSDGVVGKKYLYYYYDKYAAHDSKSDMAYRIAGYQFLGDKFSYSVTSSSFAEDSTKFDIEQAKQIAAGDTYASLLRRLGSPSGSSIAYEAESGETFGVSYNYRPVIQPYEEAPAESVVFLFAGESLLHGDSLIDYIYSGNNTVRAQMSESACDVEKASAGADENVVTYCTEEYGESRETDTDREANTESETELLEQSFRPEMLRINDGSFQQGSDSSGQDNELPVGTVDIEAFELGKYEVTVNEFRAFADATGYATDAEQEIFYKGCIGHRRHELVTGWHDVGFDQDGDHPVVCISFNDAVAYVDWLNDVTEGGYRLPSESEWEYAARAGRNGELPVRDTDVELCEHANLRDKSGKKELGGFDVGCDDGHVYTAPVGSFRENAFGLHDMHGNVKEWVSDCYHDSYDGAPLDGSSWVWRCSATTVSGSVQRTYRGGSWANMQRQARSAVRNYQTPFYRTNETGFRVARSVQR